MISVDEVRHIKKHWKGFLNFFISYQSLVTDGKTPEALIWEFRFKKKLYQEGVKEIGKRLNENNQLKEIRDELAAWLYPHLEPLEQKKIYRRTLVNSSNMLVEMYRRKLDGLSDSQFEREYMLED